MCCVCRLYGVLGALLRVVYMAGVPDGFWFVNQMFPTVTQLTVEDVVGHIADQIYG